MIDAGVRVRRFRPVKTYAAQARRQPHAPQDPRRGRPRRAHRRSGDRRGVDGRTPSDPDHWRDTHVRVRGPVVRGLFGAFAENWLEATGEVLVGDGYLPALEPAEDGGPMMVVRSSAGVGDSNIEALYYLAIAAARETLDLTAAYFAPRPAFIEALQDAAERGVRVRVLVPGENIDKPPVWLAGRAAYDELIEAGVEIHEYQPTMLAREDADRRRRVVGRRLGELRQPLVPAQRRGDPVRHLGRVRRRADGAVRARPRRRRAHRAGALEAARPASSAPASRRSSSRGASCERGRPARRRRRWHVHRPRRAGRRRARHREGPLHAARPVRGRAGEPARGRHGRRSRRSRTA